MNTFILGLGLLVIPIPPDVELSDINRFPPPAVVDAYLEKLILPHKQWVENQLNQVPSHKAYWETLDYWRAYKTDMYWRWDVWDDLRIAHRYRCGGILYRRLNQLFVFQYWPQMGPGFLQRFYWSAVLNALEDGMDYQKATLRNLRSKIGLEAYYLGVMPTPVPIWLFDIRD